MSQEDPFLSAQADILSLLQQCRPLLQSYIRIRSSASSATQPELVEARQDLESTLTDLGADLQDLVDSVRAVEGDPYRYGLDIDEVSRRRRLVEDVGREVEDMHQQLNQTVSAATSPTLQKRPTGSLAHPDEFDDDDPLAADGDGYEEWEEQRQMEIMHEQDEALDGVFQTVGNLRAQADTMGRELEEQAELLEETDNITDRVGGKLAKGLKGIRTVIERNEGEFARSLWLSLRSVVQTNCVYRQMVRLLHCGPDICADLTPDPGPGSVNSLFSMPDKMDAPPHAPHKNGCQLRHVSFHQQKRT